jgi:hypothetical protein
MRRLNCGDATETKELVVPTIAMEPIIVETNTLSEATVSFVSLRDLDEKGLQVGRLLWPATTIFPTLWLLEKDAFKLTKLLRERRGPH